MSTLALELGAELEPSDPEDARSIGRTWRQMIQIAGRKRPAPGPPASVQRYEMKARPLGLKPGLSCDNAGGLLARAEGEDWS